MKIKSLLIALACVAGSQAYGQFTFSVSPGLGFNSSSFGYKINRLVPFASFQFGHMGIKSVTKKKEYDPSADAIVDVERTVTVKGSIYMPSLGVKYFLIENQNLRGYASLTVSKPIVTASIEDEDDPFYEDYLSDYTKDVSFWAGELGVGAEYSFSEQFSLSGEFGLRYFRTVGEFEYDASVFDPNSGTSVSYKRKLSTSSMISPTYTKISLNFYFGGKAK